VEDAQSDLAFGIDILGLRLVKKTVNFDSPGVYHFYYATSAGRRERSGRRFPTGRSAFVPEPRGADRSPSHRSPFLKARSIAGRHGSESEASR